MPSPLGWVKCTLLQVGSTALSLQVESRGLWRDLTKNHKHDHFRRSLLFSSHQSQSLRYPFLWGWTHPHRALCYRDNEWHAWKASATAAFWVPGCLQIGMIYHRKPKASVYFNWFPQFQINSKSKLSPKPWIELSYFYTIICKIKFLKIINTSLLLHQLLVTGPQPKCSHYRTKHSKSKSVSPCLYTGGLSPYQFCWPFTSHSSFSDTRIERRQTSVEESHWTSCN